jgi:hypothetical protein
VCLALGTAACSYEFSTRTLGVPVTLAEPLAQPVPGDTFRVTTRASHLLWGLVPARRPSLQEALARQLGAGAAVHELRIHARKRWSDVLVTGLTMGLYSTTSVTYEGVITRAAR